jgi:hypothetical protein
MRATSLVPAEQIQSRILVLRGQRVLLDRDLAALYEVTTKRLNEQVRRNPGKFPRDFMFQLTATEASALRSHFATSKPGRGGRRYRPFAFTEHGAIQAANVLNSDTATAVGVQVVRAFLRLRQLLINHKALAAKLTELDARVGAHDEQLAAVIRAIRHLTSPLAPRTIGRSCFHRGNR